MNISITIINIISIFFMSSSGKQVKPKIIYVADTMCSWSYGFAPQIQKIKDHFNGNVDFELVNGGLRPYGTKLISESPSFLKGHWQEVEERTSQKFNYDLLTSKTFIVDTEPPARAVVAVRQMQPALEFEFFLGVQKMIFADNQDPRLIESYSPLLKELKLNEQAFKELFESPEMKQRTQEDFTRSARLGVRGFPSILVTHDNKITKITSGYTSAAYAIEAIEQIVEK